MNCSRHTIYVLTSEMFPSFIFSIKMLSRIIELCAKSLPEKIFKLLDIAQSKRRFLFVFYSGAEVSELHVKYILCIRRITLNIYDNILSLLLLIITVLHLLVLLL